jgi:hypothetical protein
MTPAQVCSGNSATRPESHRKRYTAYFANSYSEIYPELYVLAEEFSDWEDSWRSIDLLCLYKRANLVVVELKRTEDGEHMETSSSTLRCDD